MSGFATIHRRASEHPLLRKDSARFGAWVMLILKAAWKPTPFDIRGTIVTLERGQLCISVRQLAEEWGWSKSAVERFLTRLETETMIDREAGHGRLVITIRNYSQYQDMDEGDRDTSGTPTGTPAGHQRDIKEQGNQGTREIPSEANASSGSSADAEMHEPTDGPEHLPAKPKSEPIPVDYALDCYAKAAERTGWPKIKTLTEARKKKLRSRLREIGIERWKDALRLALKSPYLGTDPPSWFTFDWLIKNPENILKVLEGNYDKRSDGSGQSAPSRSSNPVTESARRLAQLSNDPRQRGDEQQRHADAGRVLPRIADARH